MIKAKFKPKLFFFFTCYEAIPLSGADIGMFLEEMDRENVIDLILYFWWRRWQQYKFSGIFKGHDYLFFDIVEFIKNQGMDYEYFISTHFSSLEEETKLKIFNKYRETLLLSNFVTYSEAILNSLSENELITLLRFSGDITREGIFDRIKLTVKKIENIFELLKLPKNKDISKRYEIRYYLYVQLFKLGEKELLLEKLKLENSKLVKAWLFTYVASAFYYKEKRKHPLYTYNKHARDYLGYDKSQL